MDIILKKPIDEITPKIIEFNNEELLRQADIYLAKFKGRIFDENSIAEAKEIRAELNKISSALNRFRIEVKNEYEKPIKKFKTQIDEVIAKFDEVGKEIGSSIDEHTERIKAEKREKIVAIYDEVFGSLADNIPLDRVYNSKWENKSYSIDNIRLDILDLHNRIIQDIEAIYNMQGVDIVDLKYKYFKLLNLSMSISEYKREQESKEFLKRQEEERTAKIIDWNKKVENGEIGEPTPLKAPNIINEPTFDLSFKCTLTKSQMLALKEFFVANKIKYEKI